MKKLIGLTLLLLSLSYPSYSQGIDTNYYETATASLAANWLKSLQLAPGTGHISGLVGLGMNELSLQSRTYIDSNGVLAYYNNPSLLLPDLQRAKSKSIKYFTIAKKCGLAYMRTPTMFSWGFMEPTPGNYHYEFSDTVVKYAGLNGVKLMGTVLPNSDSANTVDCNVPSSGCQIFTGFGDFFFINSGVTGQICPSDTQAFYNFVYNLVERYDGDGINDMQGLLVPITLWEFSNEPEGPCGNYEAQGYIKDLRVFYRAVKNACPNCEIMNGGSLEMKFAQDTVFWQTVIDSTYQLLNYGNIHDNDGKSNPNFEFHDDFYRIYKVFRDRFSQKGTNQPIWVTEWGFYSGSPNGLPTRTEEQQASLYAKYYLWGLTNNTPMFVYDFLGSSNNTLGSAALFENYQSDTLYARLWLYTSRLLEYKLRDASSITQHLFSTDPNLSVGHFSAQNQGNTFHIVWGLNSLPSQITGVKKIIDIYGNIEVKDVSTLSFPLNSNPIIIEDTTSTTLLQDPLSFNVHIFPNPAQDKIFLNTHQPIDSYEIYSSDGKLLLQGNYESHIPIQSLNNGVYCLILRNHQKYSINKFIKN